MPNLGDYGHQHITKKYEPKGSVEIPKVLAISKASRVNSSYSEFKRTASQRTSRNVDPRGS